MRTAPVPLYLLAREVHAHDLKVVVTGEGADELFWGYDLFKEVAIRSRHRDDPERAMELLAELYPYLGAGGARRGPGWARFLFEAGAADDPLASHLTRVDATASVAAFYRDDVAAGLSVDAALEPIRDGLPADFAGWDPLERAAWLEVTTLLEPYLLAAQGDRVAMAHGVEGRYPFLDHRVYASRWRCRRRGSSTDYQRQGRPPRRSPTSCCRRRSRPAASSPTGRPRSFRSSPPGPRLGRGDALAGRPRRGRDLGPASGRRACCGAAGAAARPASARGWR